MATDATGNTLMSTITHNIITINNVNIQGSGLSSFHLPCFERSLKFYGFFTDTTTINFNHIYELTMYNSDMGISRFEIYFKRDITNNNRIYIESFDVHSSRPNMMSRYEHSNDVTKINGKFFDTDVIIVGLDVNDQNTQVAYADVDIQEVDIRFKCP